MDHSLNQHSPAAAVLRGWGGIWVCGMGWGVRGRLGGVYGGWWQKLSVFILLLDSQCQTSVEL